MKMTTSRTIGVVICAAALASAQRAPQVTIERVEALDRPVSAYFRTTTDGAHGSSWELKAFLDGKEMPRSSAPHEKPGAAVRLTAVPLARDVVLVVDISRSVTYALWEQVQRAAQQTLERLPREWPVALVTVGNDVRTVTPLTTDRKGLASAISKLSASDSRTLLYDALRDVPTGRRSVVVLFTDGIDDGSTTTAEEALQYVKSTGTAFVTVDASAPIPTRGRFLRRLAAASGGRYVKVEEALESLSVGDALTAGAISEGVLSFDDPALEHPGFHELKLVATDRKTGSMLGESSQAFYSVGNRDGGSIRLSTWFLGLSALCLLGLLVGVIALLLLRSRSRQVPESTAAASQPVPAPTEEAPQLRELRERIKTVRDEADRLEKRFVEYGHPLEQKAQRWRATCHETARKTVSALKSCWLMREESTEASLIYNELLGNLSGLGVTEIAPAPGENVDDTDRRYLICEKRGVPPYRVVKVLAPGFQYAPRMAWPKEPGDDALLAPAELEVEGSTAAGAGPAR